MSKNAMLSDAAHAALARQKRDERESLSAVVLRLVPPPIETFGDLEAHLQSADSPLAVDFVALDRVLERKRKANHAD
jgi:hypothetical protein